jgi:hypothetical protein
VKILIGEEDGHVIRGIGVERNRSVRLNPDSQNADLRVFKLQFVVGGIYFERIDEGAPPGSVLFNLRSFGRPSFSCTPQFLLALLLLELAQADPKLIGLNAKLGPVGWNFFGLFGCLVFHRNPAPQP